jgi:ribonucleoside-diphosphate reductase alpha chain
MVSIYKELSEERKELQEQGLVPEWYTTAAWQMFKSKYAVPSEGIGVKPRFRTIADTLAQELPSDQEQWADKFFDLMWKGWFSPSSPMLANTGTTRGCPVSCSGSYVADSIDGFYGGLHEAALLSKHGFGTSAYLGDIRARGTNISVGGKASGVVPVLKDFVSMTRNVSQGGIRRGSFAGYIEIEGDDFWEVVELIHKEPDDLNIGWCVRDSYIERLNANDEDALARFKRVLKVKAETGKGYFFFVDKVNRANPAMYAEHGLSVKASNLCTEITLHSSPTETFTCVLGSMNAVFYDDWKGSPATYVATVMLDCLASSFITIGKSVRGLEKAVRFTENHRALGLGLLGFHSYLQSKMIPFESLEAHLINGAMFKELDQESLRASKDLAILLGEPFYCKGFGVRNTHRLAVAPNMSTAVLMGGVSQGIEPMIANVFNQGSAVGELERINPEFLKLLKAKGKYTSEIVEDVAKNLGSCQHLDFLSDEEKLVFKTAFEIDQEIILRLASNRQQYIDQAQSINLFFNANESEEYIAKIHKIAFLDPRIKSLYYMRTQAGVKTSKDECISCAG